MSSTINGGLQLTIPSLDDTNWTSVVDAIWTAISAHDHDSANNKGAAIGAAALAANGATDASIRLRNNQPLRGRNAADSADVNVLKVNTSNYVDMLQPNCLANIQAITATSGTYTVTGNIVTFSNGSATTATFNAGVAGQQVVVHNIGAGTVTLTMTGRPGASDVATIVQGGSMIAVMINSLWQPFAGVGCTLG